MGIYNVCDFGALGDGKTNDAAAIQRAIDACSESGGGRVLIPAGKTFLTGNLVVKSNVEFYVERGAVLLASPNGEDYVADIEHSRNIALFKSARGVENISFTGGGVIDGGGRFYVEAKTPHIYRMKRRRPFTFFLTGCRNVTFHDITIRDGAVWTIRLTGCRDVVIQGIRILNDLLVPNSDAIDIDHCQNVRFSNILCRSENGAFVYGWDMGMVKDIVFENVRIELDKWSDEPGSRHDLRPIPGEDNGLAHGVYDYPTAGFFLKNAENVTLRNCEVVWGANRPDYFRHALESHNVKGLLLEGFKGESAFPDKYEALLIE